MSRGQNEFAGLPDHSRVAVCLYKRFHMKPTMDVAIKFLKEAEKELRGNAAGTPLRQECVRARQLTAGNGFWKAFDSLIDRISAVDADAVSRVLADAEAFGRGAARQGIPPVPPFAAAGAGAASALCTGEDASSADANPRRPAHGPAAPARRRAQRKSAASVASPPIPPVHELGEGVPGSHKRPAEPAGPKRKRRRPATVDTDI